MKVTFIERMKHTEKRRLGSAMISLRLKLNSNKLLYVQKSDHRRRQTQPTTFPVILARGTL